MSQDDYIILDISDIPDQLYNSVISASYNSALGISKVLVSEGKSGAVKDVVTRLLYHGTPNTVSYAYRLWLGNEKDLVINCFPPAFKFMFNGEYITFVDNHYGLPLKLNDFQEDDTDRKAYGDGRKMVNNEMRWKFIPLWDNNAVYFKIFNLKYKQWLKLVMKAEDRGDRRAFGSDADENSRHQWYIHPAMNGENLLFYFFNRKFDMALYLRELYGANNDRIAWGYNGRALGQPGTYGWKIE